MGGSRKPAESLKEVEDWRASEFGTTYTQDPCRSADRLFPVRVPLVPSSDDEAPLGFILVGPRPDGTIISKDERSAFRAVRADRPRDPQRHQARGPRGEIVELIERVSARLDELGNEGRRQRPPQGHRAGLTVARKIIPRLIDPIQIQA